jgi:DNA-binding response OmpR family regulator
VLLRADLANGFLVAPLATHAPGNHLGSMLHILLVEDNPAEVFMIREALRRSPIPTDVTIAFDGEQALKLLINLRFKPDFIILDLNLPKCDGHTLLQKYQAQDGPPVIVFSVSRNDLDKQKAMALGARDYVMKPLGFDEYMGAVQGIVERWSKGASAPAL